MKTILLFFTLLLFTLSLHGQDIDAQMQEIREASPSERVQLMNQLKRRIVQMNQTERTKAINELRVTTKQKNLYMNQRQFQNTHESFVKQKGNQQHIVNNYMQKSDLNPMQFPR